MYTYATYVYTEADIQIIDHKDEMAISFWRYDQRHDISKHLSKRSNE